MLSSSLASLFCFFLHMFFLFSYFNSFLSLFLLIFCIYHFFHMSSVLFFLRFVFSFLLCAASLFLLSIFYFFLCICLCLAYLLSSSLFFLAKQKNAKCIPDFFPPLSLSQWRKKVSIHRFLIIIFNFAHFILKSRFQNPWQFLQIHVFLKLEFCYRLILGHWSMVNAPKKSST